MFSLLHLLPVIDQWEKLFRFIQVWVESFLSSWVHSYWDDRSCDWLVGRVASIEHNHPLSLLFLISLWHILCVFNLQAHQVICCCIRLSGPRTMHCGVDLWENRFTWQEQVRFSRWLLLEMSLTCMNSGKRWIVVLFCFMNIVKSWSMVLCMLLMLTKCWMIWRRFGKVNDYWIFYLHKEIATLSQCTMFLLNYFS